MNRHTLSTIVWMSFYLVFLSAMPGCQPASPPEDPTLGGLPGSDSSTDPSIDPGVSRGEQDPSEETDPGAPGGPGKDNETAAPTPSPQPTIAPDDEPAAAPLTVSGIVPSSGLNTGVVTIAHLSGTGFKTGATVVLVRSGQPDRPVTDIVVTGGTWITGTVDLNGAAPGMWDVVVTNPDGESARLANGFMVTRPITVRVPILLYHRIGPVVHDDKWTTPTALRAHLAALKAYGYTAITAQDMLNYVTGASTPPAKPVWITFDDGYENFLTEAYPILSDPAIDMPVTCFIITGCVGQTNEWEGTLPIVNYLTWEQITALWATGRVDFQSHSHTHPNLIYYPVESLQDQLAVSRQELESRLGTTVRFIAWPYGEDNATTRAAAEAAGYFAGLTALGGVETNSLDLWALRRIEIDPQISVEYNPAHPSKFFMTQIQEPGFSVPEISVEAMQWLDPADDQPVNEVRKGSRVKIRISVVNAGAAADVRATLQIKDAANTIIYDSHEAAPAQEAIWELGAGQQTFEWTCTVPSTAQTGGTLVAVHFYDRHRVLVFARSEWQTGFIITAP